jgi:hypothetical protein
MTPVVKSMGPRFPTPATSPQAAPNEMVPYFHFKSDAASNPASASMSPASIFSAGNLPFAPVPHQVQPVVPVAVPVPRGALPTMDIKPTDAHPGFNPPSVAPTTLSLEDEIEMLPHSGAVIDAGLNEADMPQTEVEPSYEGALTQPDLEGKEESESNESEDSSSDDEIELDADGLRSVESCVATFFKIAENEAGERPCWVCKYASFQLIACFLSLMRFRI